MMRLKMEQKQLYQDLNFHGSKNNILYIKNNNPRKLLARISGKIL